MPKYHVVLLTAFAGLTF